MSDRSLSILIAAALTLVGTALLLLLGGSAVSAVVMTATGSAAIAVLLALQPPVIAPQPPGGTPPPPPLALFDHPDFAALADASDLVMLLIGDGRVRFANAAARAMLGGFISGADVRTAIRHPAAIDWLTQAPPRTGTIALVGLGRADQHISMRTTPLAGGLTLVLLTDQSERVAIERMRTDFVANASHELRTPLAAILGFVETLADSDAGDDAAVRARFLGIIDTEARRMQTLVDDLLSISRIEASKSVVPDGSVALAPLIRSVIADLAAMGDVRAQDVTSDYAEDLPLVRGDAVQLAQMLNNIIGNAMKYGRATTPISVAVAAAAGWVSVRVSDHGDGIATEHLPRLTERFYRVDSARSRAVGGTGLGLAIVRHIVERHRGQLDIASDAGVGTTVSVRLPIAPVPHDQRSPV